MVLVWKTTLKVKRNVVKSFFVLQRCLFWFFGFCERRMSKLRHRILMKALLMALHMGPFLKCFSRVSNGVAVRKV